MAGHGDDEPSTERLTPSAQGPEPGAEDQVRADDQIRAADDRADDGVPPAGAADRRWTGSAPVPPAGGADGAPRRRPRWPWRDATQELPTVDNEPWPPPPPPRPANAPVTAPYPPPPLPPRPYPPSWPGPPPGPPPWPARGAQRLSGPGYAFRPEPHGRPYAARPHLPARRRRRWPWVLGTFLAVTLACCGCCASWVKPFFDEYPATAALPPTVGNLVLGQDAASRRTAEQLENEVRGRNLFAEGVFAGVYADPRNRSRPVTIFGLTQLVVDPRADLESTLDGLTERYQLTDLRDVEPGRMGGHQRCGAGRSAGKAATVCGFADHGSVAVGVFTDRPLAESETLLRDLREAIIKRG